MEFYIVQGISLGLAVAIAPGPLQAYLLAQAVRFGPRHTLPLVFAPVVSDVPIIALVLFLLIRSINNMSRKKEEAPAAPPGPTAEEKLLAEIRDLLRERR